MQGPADHPTTLPDGLPVPTDDGLALHLVHARLPSLPLPGTDGREHILAELTSPTVLFFYPRTGVPGQPPNLGFAGEPWESIPGARGCTPQSCGFRDLHSQFQQLGVAVHGVSTNTTEHQREFKQRNHVPFEFLSDSSLALTRHMRLPTFEFPVESGGPSTLIRRMAWYCDGGRILKVWYPVFPPDRNAATVLEWLRARDRVRLRPINATDHSYLEQEMTRHWGGTQIWSRGEMYEGLELTGLIAEVDGERAGAITWSVLSGGYLFEVVTVSTTLESAGVGEKLLDAAVLEAQRLGCSRAFLTTTNDNMRALRFYQKRGWRICMLHRGMVDEARRRKPFIPRVGLGGIPLRDEIELELWLEEPREDVP
ncbi:MAG TPA: GNAT family N-acetyltransferase [Phycisphaerales bacterium]|nr:GNAT family N-acetyltransferase [Phycisphaerales bacterium]